VCSRICTCHAHVFECVTPGSHGDVRFRSCEDSVMHMCRRTYCRTAGSHVITCTKPCCRAPDIVITFDKRRIFLHS